MIERNNANAVAKACIIHPGPSRCRDFTFDGLVTANIADADRAINRLDMSAGLVLTSLAGVRPEKLARSGDRGVFRTIGGEPRPS